MKEKITKRELLEVMKQIEDGERGQKFVGLVCILAFLVPIIFAVIFASCSPQRSEMDIVEPMELEMEEKTFPNHSTYQEEWDAIYANIDTEMDDSVDMEVWRLREELEPYGISVFRIDPNNPEHQRRYKRHLSGDLNPAPESRISKSREFYANDTMTDWQKHKAHYYPKNGTLYEAECPHCQQSLIKRIEGLSW